MCANYQTSKQFIYLKLLKKINAFHLYGDICPFSIYFMLKILWSKKGGTYNTGSSIYNTHEISRFCWYRTNTLPPPFYYVLFNCIDSFWKCKTIRTESASALSALMNQSVFLSGLFGIRLHKLKWLFPWLWIFY